MIFVDIVDCEIFSQMRKPFPIIGYFAKEILQNPEKAKRRKIAVSS